MLLPPLLPPSTRANLRKPEIEEAIKAAQDDLAKAANLNKVMILSELKRIAFSDLTDFGRLQLETREAIAMDKPAKKKAAPDWEAIEREYRAGQLSVAEIARQHGISHTAVNKKVKADGWVRNLAKQVRDTISARLVSDEVSGVSAREHGLFSPYLGADGLAESLGVGTLVYACYPPGACPRGRLVRTWVRTLTRVSEQRRSR